MHRRTQALVAFVAAVVVSGPVFAFAAEPSTNPSMAELQDQIRQLQTKLERLEAQQQGANARVIDDTVERVMRDSERRSRFLQNDTGLTAGYSEGRFFLASTDGNWSLIPHLHFQFRNTTNVNTAGDDSIENGFEVRRLKPIFDGTAITKELFYHFQWNTSTNGGGLVLEDAFVRYTFDTANGLQVKLGQYKDPWGREWNLGDPFQLVSERSLMDALIGGQVSGRVQGVSLIQEAEHYRAELMYHDGINSLNTNFEDQTGGVLFSGGGGTNFGVAGRFDYYFSDKTKEVDDFSAIGDKQDLFVVGGGFDWTQGGSNNVLFHTIDAQWENTSGLALFGAAVGAYRDLNSSTATGAPPAGTFYDWGFIVQAAYLVDEHWEPFARYDYTSLDDGALPAGAEDQIHEITIGTNYYFHKHNAKLTLDASWLPNGSPVTLSGQDYLASDDDEFVLRAQFQLYL